MEEAITLLRVFPFSPVAALLLAAVFARGVFRSAPSTYRRRILFRSSLLWGLYAFWELYMRSWRSSSGDLAIRVDLVLLVPLLLVVGAIGLRALLNNKSEHPATRSE